MDGVEPITGWCNGAEWRESGVTTGGSTGGSMAVWQVEVCLVMRHWVALMPTLLLLGCNGNTCFSSVSVGVIWI